MFLQHEFRWLVVDDRIHICAPMGHWLREFSNGMISNYCTAGMVNLGYVSDANFV